MGCGLVWRKIGCSVVEMSGFVKLLRILGFLEMTVTPVWFASPMAAPLSHRSLSVGI
jgi:hypothetical protein